MERHRYRALMFSALLAIASIGPTSLGIPFNTSGTARAACVKQLTFSDHVPQAAANGGSMVWKLGTLHASDWNSGGFAAEVLWVGTDGDQADDSWVEVGVTHGWQGQDKYYFYTAEAINGGGYSELRYTLFPAVGQTDTFRVYASPLHDDEYRAEITSPSGTFYTRWTGHHPATVDISGGLEATCNNSQVDRTNVTSVKYRASSNGAYNNVNNGTLVDAASVGGTAWCTQPTKFRYYLNSSTPTGTC